LTARAVDAGLNAGLPVMISTDDQEIHDEAVMAGAEGGFLRPDHLATDEAKTLDVLIHAVELWESRHDQKVEAVVILQPTAPLREAKDVSAALEMWRNRPDGSRSLSSFSYGSHLNLGILYQIKEGVAQGIAPASFSRHDEAPLCIRNGAIYISETGLLKEGRILCDKIAAHIMLRWKSVNVDDPLDLHMAQILAENPPADEAKL
jgi:CMP-N,N'-diacetyllegionaminic acid synthase